MQATAVHRFDDELRNRSSSFLNYPHLFSNVLVEDLKNNSSAFLRNISLEMSDQKSLD